MRKKTNEEFQEELRQLREQRRDIYCDDEYIGDKIKLWFYCSKDHRWQARPNNILAGEGCPYCSNKKVWRGYNDLWTTKPDVAKLLKDKEDGYKYTMGSNKEAEFICPCCKSVVKRRIIDVYYNGVICQICSDGVSYPNKFIRQVMRQLGINFIPEYSAPWSESKIYDCYFKCANGREYVIEMDGVQHYVDNCMYHQTLEDIQKNDRLKTRLANDNGISMIRINCSISGFEYIKKNILKSKLNDIFDLSAVDWHTCDANAQSNLVKEACNLYMSGVHKPKDIAGIMRINVTTIRRYLQRGVKFGWCNYNIQNAHNKPVVATNNKSGETLFFDGVHVCCDKMLNNYGVKLHAGKVSEACKTGKIYKGFIFEHVDYNNTKLMKGA